MPTCYLIALTQSSAQDVQRGSFSLFHLTEQLMLEPAPAGQPWLHAETMELHLHWLFAAEEPPCALRLCALDETGAQHVAPLSYPLKSEHQFMRLVIAPALLPSTPGLWRLKVQWRPQDSPDEAAWTEEDAFWPLRIHSAPSPPPPPPRTV